MTLSQCKVKIFKFCTFSVLRMIQKVISAVMVISITSKSIHKVHIFHGLMCKAEKISDDNYCPHFLVQNLLWRMIVILSHWAIIFFVLDFPWVAPQIFLEILSFTKQKIVAWLKHQKFKITSSLTKIINYFEV